MIARTGPTSSSPKPLPDLTVKRLEASDGIIFPGDEVTFSAQVANIGDADSKAFDLLLDGGYNGSIKVRMEQGLAAGESQQVSLGPLTISDWAEHQFFEAVADSSKEVAESKERNNKKNTVLWYPQAGGPPGPPGPPGPFPPH